MKKKIIIVFAILLSLSMFLYFKFIYGWMEFRKNTDTPEEYLSQVVIDKDRSIHDKATIVTAFRRLLAKRVDFFSNGAYFDSTEIIIDTIVYSTGFDKMAILLMIKNPTYRQLAPEKNYQWYYDATCYLGVRNKDSIELSWVGPNFTNSPSRQKTSKILRTTCFRIFATKDTTDAYAYNINDIRFWSSSIWNEIEEKKLNRRKFEEEKMKHPENVYEPPR